MNLDPTNFPDLESVQVTLVEETPDGRRFITVYGSLSDIPEFAPASVGSPERRIANAVALQELVKRAYQQRGGVVGSG